MANRDRVTSRIASYIRSNIRDGIWKVGDKLPSESEMCELMDASRTSVRSALQQYTALGILKSVHGKGTFVVSDDMTLFGDAQPEESGAITHAAREEMKQLLELRSLIEPSICERVAPVASQELLKRLEDLLDIMKDSVGNPLEFVRADMDFHMAICEELGNPMVTDLMRELSKAKIETYYAINAATGFYGGIYYHMQLLNAFKQHNAKKAQAYMLEHLERSIDDINEEEIPDITTIAARSTAESRKEYFDEGKRVI